MITKTRTTVTLATAEKGLSAPNAIQLANRLRLAIVPNKEFDRRLVETETWKAEREIYPAWTGTHIAYPEVDKAPGRFIHYTDRDTGIRYTFEVPVEARNEKNIALALNHGFTAEGKPLIEHGTDGSLKDVFVEIADTSRIKVLQGFPVKDGWYLAENEFMVPLGKEVDSSHSGARRLWRDSGSYVGLAARLYAGFDVRRNVGLGWLPSDRAGVLAWRNGNAPAEEVSKQEAQTKHGNESNPADSLLLPTLLLVPEQNYLGDLGSEIAVRKIWLSSQSWPFETRTLPPEPIFKN